MDFAYDGGSNVVDQYVAYLRRKIDRPFGVKHLETVRGAGYRSVRRSPRSGVSRDVAAAAARAAVHSWHHDCDHDRWDVSLPSCIPL